MIIIHSNLSSFEQEGLLQQMGFETSPQLHFDCKGLSWPKFHNELAVNEAAKQDILFIQENKNYKDWFTQIDLTGTKAIFLVLHRRQGLPLFAELAKRYLDKPVYFRFESSLSGRTFNLLKRLGDAIDEQDSEVYTTAIAQYKATFQEKAIFYLIEEILSDPYLFNLKKWALTPPPNRPYLWGKLLEKASPLQSLMSLRNDTREEMANNARLLINIHELIEDAFQ